MNNKKLFSATISLMIVLIFLSAFTSAVCTVTLDKESYIATETATAEIVCSGSEEKSDAYQLNWTNETGYVFESDTGTTPSTVGQRFYQSYTIPSTWPTGVWLNTTLTGAQLEGNDSANVTSIGSTNSLIFTNASIGGKWLGLTSSIKAIVKDENSKKITGGNCKFSVWSNDETTMLKSGITQLFDGNLKFDFILNYESFDEAKDYAVLLHCYCGSNGSSTECINEDGTTVTNSIGTAKSAFTTNVWLTINQNPLPITYQNGSDYSNPVVYAGYGEKVYFRANVTVNYDANLEVAAKSYLINNNTGEIYEEPDPKLKQFSVSSGNNTIISNHEITLNAPTGVYYIANFLDIYFNNLLVAQGIVNTDIFNVTGTNESFALQGVYTDKTNYYTGEDIHVCGNITNNYEERVEFEILYNYRCGSSASNAALDRSLLAEHTEFRAVSAGISQHQCAQLKIPFEDHLLYKTSQCYASVTIKSDYIPKFDNKLSITSSQFNVTDFGMYPEYEIDPSYPLVRLFPDWRRFDDVIDSVTRGYYRAKVNITNLQEAYLDPSGNIGDADWDVYSIFSSKMPCSMEIYNYTATLADGSTVINNPIENKALTWKDSNNQIYEKCGIGIENVNFSDTDDDYFIVKLWFEDFEERQTEALEGINTSGTLSATALQGIENKTGTFHLDIACPSAGTLGQDLTCNITAQVEDSQVVQKEVDFTCYITGDNNVYSSVNFNQMINKTSITLSQDFPVPATLTSGQQYTLQCTADYYNLGSRRDSFYDTFIAQTTTGTGGSSDGTSSGTPPTSLITGESIQDVKDKIDTEMPGTFRELLTKSYFIFPISIILIALLSLITIVIIKRKRDPYRICKTHNPEKTIKIIFSIFGIIILLTLFIIGGFYGYKLIDNNFLVKLEKQEIIEYDSTPVEQIEIPATQTIMAEYSIIRDPLFRKIILGIFIVLMIILLFKALNLQGEIRFGQNHNSIKKYWNDNKYSKMQQKLNRMQIKQEIQHHKQNSK